MMELPVLGALGLGAINLWTFAAFAYDKRQSRDGGRCVPEARLLLWAAMGGSPGALAGRRLFRHKTRKQPFVRLLWSIVIVQILVTAGVLTGMATGWTTGAGRAA